jgi:hypothetical protein
MQRWASGADKRELAIIMSDCVADLRALTTSG